MAEQIDCHRPAGAVRPIVDAARCEAKGDCVAVCPYGVFELERIDAAVFAVLPVLSKVKVWAHGMRTATTPNADACRACALCVDACPEKAIRLASVHRLERRGP